MSLSNIKELQRMALAISEDAEAFYAGESQSAGARCLYHLQEIRTLSNEISKDMWRVRDEQKKERMEANAKRRLS